MCFFVEVDFYLDFYGTRNLENFHKKMFEGVAVQTWSTYPDCVAMRIDGQSSS